MRVRVDERGEGDIWQGTALASLGREDDAAVQERLVKEINYWSDRYIKLSDDVSAGKQPRMQPENARRRVDELTARRGLVTSERVPALLALQHGQRGGGTRLAWG